MIVGIGVLSVGVYKWEHSPPKSTRAADKNIRSPSVDDGKVTVARACDLWGYDPGGVAVVVRQAASNEKLLYLDHDSKSTAVLDTDGRKLWVVNRCLK